VAVLALAVARPTPARDKKTPRKGKADNGEVMTGDALPGLGHIDRALLRTLAANQLPGASLAIARHGRLVLARGYGYANVEARKPVTPRTLFGLANCSKVFTAAAILKLVEQEKLALDDKLLDVVPRLRSRNADPRLADVTIRHLMQHRSGLPRKGARGKFEAPNQLAYLRASVARPLKFAPGTRASYSNLGYHVLAAVVRKVAGTSEERYMQEHVLRKMGIKRMRQRTPRARRDEVCYYNNGKKIPYKEPPEGFDTEWRAAAVDVVRFLVAVNGSGGGSPFVSERLMKQWHARASWGKQGSLPGNNTLLFHDKGGLDWAILLNGSHRGQKEEEDDDRPSPAYRELRRAIAATTAWPDGDLFEKYP
jgi:N-acyl-D-amino-acid deacylase